MSFNRNDHKLYKLAVDFDLTEWHLHAARILERVNGFKCAERYLNQCYDRIKKEVK